MTQILSAASIAEIVRHCAALSPHNDIQLRTCAIANDIERGGDEVRSDDEGVHFVRSVIGKLGEFIRPEYREKLEQTTILVIDEPLCIAEANFEQHAIVLFSGLFEVLKYRMELSLIVAAINTQFETISKDTHVSREDFVSTVLQAYSLSVHAYLNADPVPTLTEHLSDSLKMDAFIAFAGGLAFIVFHELAHLELNHGEVRSGLIIRPPPTLAFVEDIGLFKSWEFDADAFAFDAMTSETRCMMMVNVWYVFGLFLDYEVLAGGSDITHPMAINRVLNLASKFGALDDPSIGANTLRIFESRLTLMRSRLNTPVPGEELLSDEVRRMINLSAMINVIGTRKECNEALERLIRLYGCTGV